PPASKTWAARRMPLVRRMYHALAPPVPVPVSDGSLEALAPDIVHFLQQSAFLTRVTSIYHPSDLQHLHLPQFFSSLETKSRESLYHAFCNQPGLVAVSSSWWLDDVLRAYCLPTSDV